MEEMEMPTVCDCGNVFDLHYGSSNHNKTKTICEDCSEQNEKRQNVIDNLEQRERDLEDLEGQIESVKLLILEDQGELNELPEFK